ncbi:MAG: type II toxin-antitoxin system VapC family toxin [Kiritimatiellia bacterium]|nr:type II toxin-antitoxin system VapC family toxin [Kiritimatiellia bacterium]
MTLLLDTHIWLWALESPDQLGRRCRAALESPEHSLAVATISTVEFGQLQAAKRIVFKGTLESWVRRGIETLGLQTENLSHVIASLSYTLPGDFHKDPADRILVATAIHHGYTLVTADERILAYPHVLSMNARR